MRSCQNRLDKQQLKLRQLRHVLAHTPRGAVEFEVLLPFGPGLETHREAFRAAKKLMTSQFQECKSQVRGCIYRGRDPGNGSLKSSHIPSEDACLVSNLWLGGKLAAAAVISVNGAESSTGSSSTLHVQFLYQATAPGLQRRYGLGRLLTTCVLRAAADAGHEYATAALPSQDSATFWSKAGFAPAAAHSGSGASTSGAVVSVGGEEELVVVSRVIGLSQKHAPRTSIWLAKLSAAPAPVAAAQQWLATSGGSGGPTSLLALGLQGFADKALTIARELLSAPAGGPAPAAPAAAAASVRSSGGGGDAGPPEQRLPAPSPPTRRCAPAAAEAPAGTSAGGAGGVTRVEAQQQLQSAPPSSHRFTNPAQYEAVLAEQGLAPARMVRIADLLARLPRVSLQKPKAKRRRRQQHSCEEQDIGGMAQQQAQDSSTLASSLDGSATTATAGGSAARTRSAAAAAMAADAGATAGRHLLGPAPAAVESRATTADVPGTAAAAAAGESAAEPPAIPLVLRHKRKQSPSLPPLPPPTKQPEQRASRSESGGGQDPQQQQQQSGRSNSSKAGKLELPAAAFIPAPSLPPTTSLLPPAFASQRASAATGVPATAMGALGGTAIAASRSEKGEAGDAKAIFPGRRHLSDSSSRAAVAVRAVGEAAGEANEQWQGGLQAKQMSCQREEPKSRQPHEWEGHELQAQQEQQRPQAGNGGMWRAWPSSVDAANLQQQGHWQTQQQLQHVAAPPAAAAGPADDPFTSACERGTAAMRSKAAELQREVDRQFAVAEEAREAGRQAAARASARCGSCTACRDGGSESRCQGCGGPPPSAAVRAAAEAALAVLRRNGRIQQHAHGGPSAAAQRGGVALLDSLEATLQELIAAPGDESMPHDTRPPAAAVASLQGLAHLQPASVSPRLGPPPPTAPALQPLPAPQVPLPRVGARPQAVAQLGCEGDVLGYFDDAADGSKAGGFTTGGSVGAVRQGRATQDDSALGTDRLLAQHQLGRGAVCSGALSTELPSVTLSAAADSYGGSGGGDVGAPSRLVGGLGGHAAAGSFDGLPGVADAGEGFPATITGTPFRASAAAAVADGAAAAAAAPVESPASSQRLGGDVPGGERAGGGPSGGLKEGQPTPTNGGSHRRRYQAEGDEAQGAAVDGAESFRLLPVDDGGDVASAGFGDGPGVSWALAAAEGLAQLLAREGLGSSGPSGDLTSGGAAAAAVTDGQQGGSVVGQQQDWYVDGGGASAPSDEGDDGDYDWGFITAGEPGADGGGAGLVTPGHQQQRPRRQDPPGRIGSSGRIAGAGLLPAAAAAAAATGGPLPRRQQEQQTPWTHGRKKLKADGKQHHLRRAQHHLQRQQQQGYYFAQQQQQQEAILRQQQHSGFSPQQQAMLPAAAAAAFSANMPLQGLAGFGPMAGVGGTAQQQLPHPFPPLALLDPLLGPLAAAHPLQPQMPQQQVPSVPQQRGLLSYMQQQVAMQQQTAMQRQHMGGF